MSAAAGGGVTVKGALLQVAARAAADGRADVSAALRELAVAVAQQDWACDPAAPLLAGFTLLAEWAAQPRRRERVAWVRDRLLEIVGEPGSELATAAEAAALWGRVVGVARRLARHSPLRERARWGVVAATWAEGLETIRGSLP